MNILTYCISFVKLSLGWGVSKNKKRGIPRRKLYSHNENNAAGLYPLTPVIVRVLIILKPSYIKPFIFNEKVFYFFVVF